MINDILAYNNAFVANKDYQIYETSKYPNKKLAIVTCMDTRLSELLLKALGLKNGDAKIIKNAGGTISHPYGSAVRSLLIAIYELGVEEIMVIGHSDCGVQHMEAIEVISKMKQRGIDINKANPNAYGVDLMTWLDGFQNVETAITESVHLLKHHPLITKDIQIYGFIMDSLTGKLNAL